MVSEPVIEQVFGYGHEVRDTCLGSLSEQVFDKTSHLFPNTCSITGHANCPLADASC